jgi:phosphoribosyl 1,2-cyclic phosphodiesterase
MSNFYIKFLGVRGSTPCCEDSYLHYGGHTSCVISRCDNKLLIFDAGSGIASISYDCLKDIKEVYLFFSHFHLDHVLGLPFLKAMWNKNITVHIYSGTLKPYGGVQKFLSSTFSPPLFPVAFDDWPCEKKMYDIDPGSTIKINDIQIDTCSLNHPNGSIGYRVTYNNKSFCYITDHEHSDEKINNNLINFINEANYFIYDSSFEDDEYPKYKGWGHSTWQEAIRIGNQANVENVVLFHHEPFHTDTIMEKIEETVNIQYNNVIVSKQGMKINLM